MEPETDHLLAGLLGTKTQNAVPEAPQVVPDTIGSGDLCAFLGVSRQVLTDLKNQCVIAPVKRGQWAFSETVRAYLEHLREKAAGRDERTLNEEQRRAKLDLTQAQARRAALIADRDAGKLLDSGQVEREWANTLRDVRAALLAVPSRVGAALPHLTAHDVELVSGEIRAALETLADGETNGN